MYIGAFVLGCLTFLLVLVATDPGDALSFVGHGAKTDPAGNRILTLSFRNNTDNPYSNLLVEVNLLGNDADRPLTTKSAEANTLSGHEVWHIEIPLHNPDIARFQVQKLHWQNIKKRSITMGPYRIRDIALIKKQSQ